MSGVAESMPQRRTPRRGPLGRDVISVRWASADHASAATEDEEHPPHSHYGFSPLPKNYNNLGRLLLLKKQPSPLQQIRFESVLHNNEAGLLARSGLKKPSNRPSA